MRPFSWLEINPQSLVPNLSTSSTICHSNKESHIRSFESNRMQARLLLDWIEPYCPPLGTSNSSLYRDPDVVSSAACTGNLSVPVITEKKLWNQWKFPFEQSETFFCFWHWLNLNSAPILSTHFDICEAICVYDFLPNPQLTGKKLAMVFQFFFPKLLIRSKRFSSCTENRNSCVNLFCKHVETGKNVKPLPASIWLTLWHPFWTRCPSPFQRTVYRRRLLAY